MVVSCEAKKAQTARPSKRYATTAVTHLHGEIFLQFSKILHHVLKSAWQNLKTYERIHPSYHRHKTFVLVLCTT